MTITKSIHKAYLFSLFYPEVNGQRRERTFTLDKLVDAASAFKKLKETSKEEKRGESFVYNWKEEPLEFAMSEANILRDLVLGIKEAPPSEAEVISELKSLFK